MIKNMLTKPNVSLHAHVPAIHYMSCTLCNNNNVCIPGEGEGDHGPPQQQLNVPANFSRECLTINITNDNVTEENELFRISVELGILFFRPYQSYHVGTMPAIVTIIDDDCKSTFGCSNSIHNNTIMTVTVVICSPTCVNGVCVHPGVCLCDEGWIDEDCSQGENEC